MSKYSQTHIQEFDVPRLRRQEEIVENWWENGRAGTLEAATGFGKTTAAMLAIEKEKMLAPLTYSKGVQVVVPSVLLQNQWEAILKKWGLRGRVDIINTVSKQEEGHYKCGLLILDEVHLYGAPVFRRVFNTVDYDDVLALTATLPEEDMRREIITEQAPIIDTVSLIECLENGWVAPFKVYNLPVEMYSNEDAEYDQLNRVFNATFATFDHDFRTAMTAVQDADFRRRFAAERGLDQKVVDASAFRWISNMQERKKLLYNLESKHDMALELIGMFPDRLIVTFSESIESAEKMSGLVGSSALAYHSQIKGGVYNGKRLSAGDMREKVLTRFASQHPLSTTRVLCTAKAFNVGADIPHVDMGIVLSGTSKSLQAIQRYGRTLRKMDGKRTIIVELYAVRRGGGTTQDLKWLSKRQKTIKSQVAWIQDPTQIV